MQREIETAAAIFFFAVIALATVLKAVQARRYARLAWRADANAIEHRIRSSPAISNVHLWMLLASAGLGASLWIPGMYAFEEFRRNAWTAWVAIAFFAGGIAGLAMFFLSIARASALGRPTFLCARVPFVPGEHLEGWIEMWPNAIVDRGVRVTLTCLWRVSAGEDSATYLLWGDTISVPASKIVRTDAIRRIPVSFQVPDDLPATGAEGGEIGWELRMSAGSGLMRLNATFAVPMSAGPSVSRAPAVVERKINVSQPGRGEIALGPAVIRVQEGKILLGTQEIKATTVRAIDIVSGFDGQSGICWNVRIHTIGGKTITAAPHLRTRAGAEAVAHKLEAILTGIDRKQVDELFGSPDRLNSTP